MSEVKITSQTVTGAAADLFASGAQELSADDLARYLCRSEHPSEAVIEAVQRSITEAVEGKCFVRCGATLVYPVTRAFFHKYDRRPDTLDALRECVISWEGDRSRPGEPFGLRGVPDELAMLHNLNSMREMWPGWLPPEAYEVPGIELESPGGPIKSTLGRFKKSRRNDLSEAEAAMIWEVYWRRLWEKGYVDSPTAPQPIFAA